VLFDLHAADFVTIGLLVVLEGLLSADNALVMAIMVLGLPREAHQRALRYGLVGGFVFRIAATLLATYLISVTWIKLLGGLYLGYLTWAHFGRSRDGESRHEPPKAKAAFGLSVFWATVVKVELVNLAFSIDSILVAVAMSPKTWVVITGGVLGIVALRLVVGQLISLVQKYPTLVDAAFVIIAWVGVKLSLEYFNSAGYIHFEIPQSLSLALIIIILGAAYLYARAKGPAKHVVHPMEEKAAELLTSDENPNPKSQVPNPN
jgi:YkoY family integral membrane protein